MASSIGERLRAEREQRGASLELLSERTGIAVDYLRALEANDIDALPGRAFGKFYIRAYGDVLGFDPSDLIEDYESEIELDAGGRKPVIRPAARETVANDDLAEETELDETDEPANELAETEVDLEPTEVDLEPTEVDLEPTEVDVAPEPSDETEVDADGDVVDGEGPEFDTAPCEDDDEDAGEAARQDEPVSPPAHEEEERPAAVSHDAPEGSRAADIAMSMPLARPTAVPDAAPHRAPPPRRGRRSSWIGVAAAAIVLLVTAVATWQVLGPGADDPSLPADSLLQAGGALDVESTLPPLEEGETADGDANAEEAASAADTNGAAEPEPSRDATVQATEEIAREPSVGGENRAASALTIDRFDIGSGISGQWIAERRQRFTEGQVAWFATRVRGGGAGSVVRHVWMRKGGVVQTIDLELGGTPWRTWSKKTLWGPGNWSVEARDAEGNVLARETFVCEKQAR